MLLVSQVKLEIPALLELLEMMVHVVTMELTESME